MNTSVLEGLQPVGARLKQIEAIPVTTSSVIIDLQARTNIWGPLTGGRIVMVTAQADVYYAFNSENAGSIDQTVTSAASVQACDLIPGGAKLPFRPPYASQQDINSSAGAITNLGMCRYLIVRGDVASTLRFYVAGEKPSQRVGL